MEVKKYRFTASTDLIDREVFPKNGNTLVISWQKENERALFSKKLKGKMLFDGDDFHWFNDIENSSFRCKPINLLIEKKCDGVYVEFFKARIILTKGDFDLDSCKLDIEVDNNDKYICYDDNGEEEFNLLQEVESNITASLLEGTLENKTCTGDQDDNLDCDGVSTSLGWILIKLERIGDVDGDYTFTAKWARELKGSADPLPLPWIDLGGDNWAKQPATYGLREVYGDNYYLYERQVGGSIDNGMLLKGIMEYLLSEVCDELTLRSNFFQWNASIITDINYVTEQISNVLKLALYQKSDVKRPYGTGDATQALTSFEKILLDICRIFNLKWDITDGGYFIIEHVSFFEKTLGLDLTTRFDKYLRIGTRRYSYDTDSLYRREVFSMMDQENYNGNFKGVPIKYLNDCAGREDKDIIVENIMTNVQYAMDNPSPDNSFVVDEGFVLIALNEDNSIISRASIFGEEYLNNTLSWPQLHVAYWRHEKLFQTFEMNNVETEALSLVPIKKQIPLNVTICCGNEFDAGKKVKSTLGTGQVDTANYGLYSENLSLVLKHYGVDVDSEHTPPIANDDAFNTVVNTAIDNKNLLPNDSGTSITCVPETKATTHGNVQIFVDGSFVYTPTTSYVGIDTFEYTIIDSLGFIDTGTVTITITSVEMPNAVNDSYTTTMNTTLNQSGIMANDTGVAPKTCLPETKSTTHGNVQIFADGHFVYTPTTSYVGTDSFTYTLIDGNSNTDSATITITISTVIMPNAVNDSYICAMNTTLNQSGIMGNDTGVAPKTCLPETKATTHGNVQIYADGHFVYTPTTSFKGIDTFDYTLIDGNSNTDNATITIEVYEDMGGAVAVDDTFSGYKNMGKTGSLIANDSGTGTLKCLYEVKATTNGGLVQINANGTFSFSPAYNVVGVYEFDYTLIDLLGSTDTGHVTITVVTPTAIDAVNDAFSVIKNAIGTANVLTNDTGEGSLACTAETKATTAGGAVQIFANGNIIYSPDFNYVGADTFTYTMHDSLGQTDTATVTITVINPPAINAVDDSFLMAKNTTFNTGNVLTNDTATTKHATPETKATTHGNVQIFANGTFNYTPTTSYVGTDSFTYTLIDDYGQTDTATVTMTIVNDDIEAVTDNYETSVNTAMEIGAFEGLLVNDIGYELVCTAGIFTTDQGGYINLGSDGNFYYNPLTGFIGTDSFTYTITDHFGNTDTGTCIIEVTA